METQTEKIERLDSMSKILVATGAINYMAQTLNACNEQIKMIHDATKSKLPDSAEALKHGIEGRDRALLKVAKDLGKIMEFIGNVLDGQDAVTQIDIRVTKAAFKIMQGEDEVERDYDEEPLTK